MHFPFALSVSKGAALPVYMKNKRRAAPAICSDSTLQCLIFGNPAVLLADS